MTRKEMSQVIERMSVEDIVYHWKVLYKKKKSDEIKEALRLLEKEYYKRTGKRFPAVSKK